MAKSAKWQKAKKKLIGGLVELGLVQKIFLYVMLISLCFVYVYPILHMGVTSLKSLTDLLDPSVQWLPHELTIENYTKALDVMGFTEHFLDTLLVTVVPALAQTFSCARWTPSPRRPRPRRSPARWRATLSRASASREEISS